MLRFWVDMNLGGHYSTQYRHKRGCHTLFPAFCLLPEGGLLMEPQNCHHPIWDEFQWVLLEICSWAPSSMTKPPWWGGVWGVVECSGHFYCCLWVGIMNLWQHPATIFLDLLWYSDEQVFPSFLQKREKQTGMNSKTKRHLGNKEPFGTA